MKSKQLLVVFWAHILLSLGCVAFWGYLYLRFGGSLLDDVWLLIVAVIVGLLAFVELLIYRVLRRMEAQPNKAQKGAFR